MPKNLELWDAYAIDFVSRHVVPRVTTRPRLQVLTGGWDPSYFNPELPKLWSFQATRKYLIYYWSDYLREHKIGPWEDRRSAESRPFYLNKLYNVSRWFVSYFPPLLRSQLLATAVSFGAQLHPTSLFATIDYAAANDENTLDLAREFAARRAQAQFFSEMRLGRLEPVEDSKIKGARSTSHWPVSRLDVRSAWQDIASLLKTLADDNLDAVLPDLLALDREQVKDNPVLTEQLSRTPLGRVSQTRLRMRAVQLLYPELPPLAAGYAADQSRGAELLNASPESRGMLILFHWLGAWLENKGGGGAVTLRAFARKLYHRPSGRVATSTANQIEEAWRRRYSLTY